MEPQPSSRHEIQFTGDGSTYFGIWIVNLLLTIVTVGLYSPWAKVRRLKYLYGNTLLDGSPFDYHGSPVALFKGRLIGVVLLLAYTQTGKISLTLWLFVVGAIAIALPWLLWKSQQFRLRNSSYRGVRFGFDGTLRQSYTTFGLPMLLFIAPYVVMGYVAGSAQPGSPPSPKALLPAGLLGLVLMCTSPWFYVRIKRYQHGNARLGSTPFTFDATVGGAYGLAFACLGLGILVLIVAVIAGGACGFLASWIAHFVTHPVLAQPTAAGPTADTMVGIVAGSVVGYAVLLGIYPITGALRQNFVWGNTRLGGAPIECKVESLQMLRIYALNAFLVIVSLGLYWPYALIRTLRYQLGAMAWTGDPGQILAAAGDSGVSAVGEESAEILGFDLAL